MRQFTHEETWFLTLTYVKLMALCPIVRMMDAVAQILVAVFQDDFCVWMQLKFAIFFEDIVLEFCGYPTYV